MIAFPGALSLNQPLNFPMNPVLQYAREREPSFNEVPDELLTEYIGDRHPEFLEENDAFKSDYERAKKKRRLQTEMQQVRGEGEQARQNIQALEAAQQLGYGTAYPITTLGKAMNYAGDVTAGVGLDIAEDVARGRPPAPGINTATAISQRGPLPGEQDLGPVAGGAVEALRTAPAVGGAVAGSMVGVPPWLSFGATMAGSASAAGAGRGEALKAGAVGALVPGVSSATRRVAGAALSKAVGRGLLSGEREMAFKAAEAIGSETGIQAFIEGMNLPEYMAMDPEQRKDAIIRNMVANVAFMGMEIPHLAGRTPSVARQRIQGGQDQGGVVQMVEALRNDDTALEALRQRVDDFVFDALDPATAGVRFEEMPGSPLDPYNLSRRETLDRMTREAEGKRPKRRRGKKAKTTGASLEAELAYQASEGQELSTPEKRRMERINDALGQLTQEEKGRITTPVTEVLRSDARTSQFLQEIEQIRRNRSYETEPQIEPTQGYDWLEQGPEEIQQRLGNAERELDRLRNEFDQWANSRKAREQSAKAPTTKAHNEYTRQYNERVRGIDQTSLEIENARQQFARSTFEQFLGNAQVPHLTRLALRTGLDRMRGAEPAEMAPFDRAFTDELSGYILSRDPDLTPSEVNAALDDATAAFANELNTLQPAALTEGAFKEAVRTARAFAEGSRREEMRRQLDRGGLQQSREFNANARRQASVSREHTNSMLQRIRERIAEAGQETTAIVRTPEDNVVQASSLTADELDNLQRMGASQDEIETYQSPDVLTDPNGQPLADAKPVTVSAWRGLGKRNPKEPYTAGADAPVLGRGEYYALSDDAALRYGPQVEPETVRLKKPKVIDSDKTLRALMGKRDPGTLEGRGPLLAAARGKLEAEGYDGAIIQVPRLKDVNQRGESTKQLGEIFGATQVIKFDPGKRAEGGEALASVEQATLPRQIEAPKLDGDEPVSLADIRTFLSKALDIPVRWKGYRQRAFGIFKPSAETIRLNALNDIPTLVHEVGHYLHYILFPSGGRLSPHRIGASDFSGRFDDELMPLGERTSRENYTRHQVRKEGVAEWLRRWITPGENVWERAPAFTAFFEGEVARRYPQVWEILNQAKTDVERFVRQPLRVKWDTMIQTDKIPDRIPLMKRLNKLYDNWVDELAPMHRALKELQRFGLSPEQAKRIADYAVNYIGGWRGKALYALKYKAIDLDGRHVGPGLQEILTGIDDLNGFRQYVVAKRALELHGRRLKSGFPHEEAKQIVREADKTWEPKRQQLREFQRSQLRLLVDSGVISKEQFTQMEAANQDYVPFYRVYESLRGNRDRRGEGFINLGQGIGRYKGSDFQVVDPLESIVKNTYLFRDLAERNRVARQFVNGATATRGGGRFVEGIAKKKQGFKVKHELIEAQFRKVLKELGIDYDTLNLDERDFSFQVWSLARNQSRPQDGIFFVWQNGKQTPYQVDDPELYRALGLMDSTQAKVFSQVPGAGVARNLTRVLRAGATLTFEFMARNPFRDQIIAGVYSKHGFIPYLDGFRGIISAVGKDELYREWVKSGGRYADFVSMDRADLQATLKDLIDEPNVLRQALRIIDPRYTINNLQRMSELMEQATRISEYRRAKARGLNDVAAANAAKDVTLNFSRAGFHGKFWNQMAAFFNAQVQDIDKMFRAHAEKPIATMLKGVAYISTPSIIAWNLGKDDKEIQNLPEWQKNFFWNVNMRWAYEQLGIDPPDDTVFHLPKPFLLGQLYGSSIERGLDFAYGKDPNAVYKWLNSVQESTPMSLNAWMPTFATPIFENMMDKQLWSDTPIEGGRLSRIQEQYRFQPGTSQVARFLSEVYPIETGRLSPVQVDNLIRGYFAGLGKYGTDTIDWLLMKSQVRNVPPKPETGLWEKPFLRAFQDTPYAASAYVDRFYKGTERAEELIATARVAPEMLDSREQQKFIQQNKANLGWYFQDVEGRDMMSHLRKGREQLGQIHAAMRSIRMNRDMDPETKRKRLLKLSEARDVTAQYYFERFLSPLDRKVVY